MNAINSRSFEILCGKKTIRVDVIYEKRTKTLLIVDPSGFVKIRSPKGVSTEDLKRMLEGKTVWIEEQLTKNQRMNEALLDQENHSFSMKERFLFQGVSYPIHILIDESDLKGCVEFKEDRLLITLPVQSDEAVKAALKKYYFQECRKKIISCVNENQKFFKEKPRKIEIKDSVTKWGQCSGDRCLMFNWKLIMAPTAVMDYVVIHEMCHMVHLNHDRSFWRLVGKFAPEHEKHSRWLTENGHHMEF